MLAYLRLDFVRSLTKTLTGNAKAKAATTAKSTKMGVPITSVSAGARGVHAIYNITRYSQERKTE